MFFFDTMETMQTSTQHGEYLQNDLFQLNYNNTTIK